VQRVVVVRLGGEVHDGVRPPGQRVHDGRVGDVPDHQLHTLGRQVLE
jgi:hypothetical protein